METVELRHRISLHQVIVPLKLCCQRVAHVPLMAHRDSTNGI